MTGKLISLVGSSGCGKTFLAEKLTEHFKGEFLPEMPEGGPPQRIVKNLQERTNFLENELWFRSYEIEKYERALSLRDEGKIVILDTPFYQNQLYATYYFRDDPELLAKWHRTGEKDLEKYPQPDCTIYIKTSVAQMEAMIQRRRSDEKGFTWESKQWAEFIVGMVTPSQKYMAGISNRIPNLITLERERWDFEKEEDLARMIRTIERTL